VDVVKQRLGALLTATNRASDFAEYFRFARALIGANMVRALCGLRNGDVAGPQTALAKLVIRKEHQPRVYGVIPVIWSNCSIIEPSTRWSLGCAM
jgi:hypothetical protein